MAVDEWVWLRHPDTGGVQYVPPSALETWTELGWEPCEAPTEPNLALAEYAPIRAAKTPRPKKSDPEPSDTAAPSALAEEAESDR